MNRKNKIIFLSSLIIGVLTLTLGVTFSIFTFNKTSTNSKLIVGDIYMHYNETNQIPLENAMPSDTYNSTNYFEFTVDGKNTTTNKDIWYEIVLSYGDNHPTRTTRIRDDLLKFRLVETKDGVETTVVDNKSYSDLNNHRIWVDTINKNTTTEVTHTYRLYMWISNNTIIGNVNQDYTMEEWNDVFASIKVNVTGDFNEKELAYEDIYNVTDASCFTTSEVITYTHNSNMTEEELNKCVTYFNTGKYDGFADSLESNGENITSFCNGTGTSNGVTFQGFLDAGYLPEEDLTYFVENNIIISNGVSLSITDYDASCGTDVVIPKTINDLTVTIIGNGVWNNGNFEKSFANKNLTSVVIPDSVTTIGDYAFEYNQLTSVTIPDSVTTIGYSAFSNNQLTSVIIGNSVTAIGSSAFEYNQLTSVTIPDSVTTIKDGTFRSNQLTSVTIPDSVTYLSCSAFDDTVTITKNEDLTCTKDTNS